MTEEDKAFDANDPEVRRIISLRTDLAGAGLRAQRLKERIESGNRPSDEKLAKEIKYLMETIDAAKLRAK